MSWRLLNQKLHQVLKKNFKNVLICLKLIFSVTRAASMSETDSVSIRYERQQSKSRPRPGHSHSPLNSLIAPPPSSQSKNNKSNDTPDLISFSSPPPVVPQVLPDNIFDQSFSVTPK